MAAKTSPVSLAEFVVAKKREGCTVCALPSDLAEQIKGAHTKKIRRPIILEWLQSVGYKITGSQLDSHYSGRHEQIT